MKRDHVLVRKLLNFVEEKGARLYKGAIQIPGYERDDVVLHIFLLSDAGFIELGQDTLTDKGALVLTWKGCDYLDELKARDRAANGSRTAARPATAPPIGTNPVRVAIPTPSPTPSPTQAPAR